MIETSAAVPTINADRYITQLCDHWAHKLPVQRTDERGIVRFDTAVAMLEPKKGELVVTILANDYVSAERLQNLVASYLDHFAFSEGSLAFEWQVRG